MTHSVAIHEPALQQGSRASNASKRGAFKFSAGRSCLWLVSTVGNRGSQPFDRLRTPADLSRWCVQARLVDRPPETTETDLEAARGLREAIYRTALARRDGHAPGARDRETINFWAMQPPPVPQLSEDGRARFWKVPLSISAILAQLARDTVELFASADAEWLKVCAQPDCAGLFLDTSRPHRRKWCSMNTCGNKAKKMALRRPRK